MHLVDNIIHVLEQRRQNAETKFSVKKIKPLILKSISDKLFTYCA